MNREDDPSREPRDDVAALIRLAGRRPAVPEDVAARVRAAAHEQWQSGLRQRERARFLRTATALAAAAAVVLAIAWSLFFRADTAGSPPLEASVRVESLSGPAWVGGRPLQAGADLPAGAEVETGEGGRVAFRLSSGHSVRLDADSRLRVLGRVALALDRGAVYVDSGKPARTPEPLSLRTPLGTVQETGTQFEVRLEADSVRIRVREGSVALEAADGLHEVGAGTELQADGRGAATREIASYGPEWDWMAGVAPRPDFAGQSVRAFLDRIAREGGWTLHFANEEAARHAAETVLEGSVSGMTPEQALDAVLPTCGMIHRIEEGRLIVDRSAN